MKTIAFFNNKGGVGKTSLVYHLAWMYADMGVSVIAADLDPQSNLTAMFLGDERLESLWPASRPSSTVFGAIRPLLDGTGDVGTPHVEHVSERIGLLAGDLAISEFEDELTRQWSDCLDRKPRAFRVVSAFWRLCEAAATERGATLVLMDVGPNLGAINRAALIAAQNVVIPLAPDLFSIQGLRNLGPALFRWRREWADRVQRKPPEDTISIPRGDMVPVGYVVMQHAVRLDRPVVAYDRWMKLIPSVYREAVLKEPVIGHVPSIEEDTHRLAALKHYRSLMPLAQVAHKPMFQLKAADGALGGHAKAVQDCYRDFHDLARVIGERCHVFDSN
ncbi:MAG: ParA family protein [Planctomycetes bacterium]|nr:ParA family protein [Planctomycetota bacterium]MCC7170687.1 ParA family protein [Planctomycetota bacterium]